MGTSDMRKELAADFNDLFEIVVATDNATRQLSYRIRHEVYCRDLGWEPVRSDGIESDEYDRHAFHCLLRRRGTGEPVGCTRLIVARPDDPGYPLPFERSCASVLDRDIVDPARLPRQTIGEVSRLAVLSGFRRRRGEQSVAVSMTDEDFGAGGTHARFPFIPVSLYLGAAAIASRIGVEHVFVLTEPRLASHFVRIGFDIRTVGGAIEHRGTRVLSLLSSSRVVAGLRPMIRPLFKAIDKSIACGLQASSIPAAC